MSENNYQHWKFSTDQDNIVWLGFDKANESVNSFSLAVLEELEQILTNLTDNKNIKGLVLYSAKNKGFIAGADIKQLSSFTEVDDAVNFIRFGQEVFNKLERLPFPSVAMINGFCMGGGLEIALACTYRVALDERSTRLALPEVKLGIHPGWGGTVRLPRLIGAPMAMDLMLSGRAVSAKAAKKMGFVDAAVPARHLKKAARYYALKHPAKHKATGMQRFTNSGLARPIIGKMIRKQLATKAKAKHYPAPYAVLKNWLRHGVGNVNEALITEANSIGELLLSDTPKNLIRVFNLMEQMKDLAKSSGFKPKRVHVIGAGVMGGDIAAWCALRGMTVTLEDREAKYISPAIKRAYKLYKKKLKRAKLIRPVMDRLIPDVRGEGAKTADVIIEAIYENLEAKQTLFKRLEAEAKPEAILASNTSSIPLDDISTVLNDPSRLVGIHFFNPVAKMPLVEVIKGEKSQAAILDNALNFVVKIGKQPIAVKSSPGFLVNRVLMPYMMEAMSLLEEHVPAATIDNVATDFGMPMGPIELADTVGLDICLSVAKNLSQHFGGQVPQRLIDMVEAKTLGRKTGSGFYQYKGNKVTKPASGSSPVSKTQIEQRLVGRMINEAVACYREGVIDDLDLLDGGMIFGTGFAPFTGGPIQYVRHMGKEQFVDKLKKLAADIDARFTPDEGWKNI